VPEDRESEAARYRRAAEAALGQVDICIRYLQKIRKQQLATRLARNRESIARQLRDSARVRKSSNRSL
jgi:hypothetical protein